MRGSKAKTLGSLFSSAIKAPPKSKSKSKSKPETLDAIAEHDIASSSTVALDCSALNLFVSATSLVKNSTEEEPEPSVLDSLSRFVFPRLKSVVRSDSGVVEESEPRDEPKQDHLTHQISSILIADALVKSHHLEDEEEEEEDDDDDDETKLDTELDMEWIPSLPRHSLLLRRKEVVQDRKLTWSFSTCQGGRFNRLVNMCAAKLGIETAFDIFGKLGVPKGAAEYDAILKVCVETARVGNTETIIVEQLNKAFMYFKSMKEHGFQLEEDIYGPFVSYLIEMAMVEEFYFFADIIKDVNPNTSPRLDYYEMLLWITVDDEEKVQDLCHHMMTEECDTDLIENYLLALCEGGRDKELMKLLRTVDFTTFTSTDNLLAIFESLGKLQWDDLVEKFLLAFKARDFRDEDLSGFICSHIVGNPNLAVEELILSFKNRHAKLEVQPSSASYEKLIRHCCGLREMESVLRLIDEAIESGLTVSLETIHHVLQSSEESYDFILVHRIYSLIREFKLEADVETFRMMIRLCVRMKNMEVAKNMLRDMEEMKLAPTSTIYNILMVACLQEKNYLGVENVLKQMQKADIQPDSLTFSHLIRKSATEEEIDKYWEVLQKSGVDASTPVYMALIQAYANCGLLEKAKQVVAGKWISGREVYRIKGVLVKALAIHGQFSEALKIYKDIKEAGHKVGPKPAISLIEYYESDGESNILLDLLEELTDPEYWLDGCARAVLNCVRRKDLSLATNLLKQLKDKLSADDEMILEAILDEVFNVIGDKESTHLQIGMDLLRVVKDDLGLAPPRKCLDFLLHACVAAKDLENSRAIWNEYDAAGLPHNIISCLRMYQALLASGDHKAANILLKKIPKDDPHVRYVMRASQVTFAGSLMENTKAKKTKKKKKKKKKKTEKKTLKGL